MIKKHFEINEKFEPIIEKALKEKVNTKTIKNIKPIYTGWTNIVYRVEADNGNYYLRFPRDEFWIRTIVKDYQFASFIKEKTSFKTVELKLAYDNERPFSIHKEIAGMSLAEKIEKMNDAEIRNISNQLAKFMYELHNIKFEEKEIFSINNIGLKLNDFITELLDKHVSNEDKEFWKTENFDTKNEQECLVHGDLNLSNVIIDENNNIASVIDFGFAGFGSKYFDLARVLSRNYPPKFKEYIIKNYEEYENAKIDVKELEKDINTWIKIDNAYKNYMKKMGIYEEK